MTERTDRIMGGDRLLTTAEVAELFRVTQATVNRWRAAGRLTFSRTPFGNIRYRESYIRKQLEAMAEDPHVMEDWLSGGRYGENR
jgi:excisionase family DNA binding protein